MTCGCGCGEPVPAWLEHPDECWCGCGYRFGADRRRGRHCVDGSHRDKLAKRRAYNGLAPDIVGAFRSRVARVPRSGPLTRAARARSRSAALPALPQEA